MGCDPLVLGTPGGISPFGWSGLGLTIAGQICILIANLLSVSPYIPIRCSGSAQGTAYVHGGLGRMSHLIFYFLWEDWL